MEKTEILEIRQKGTVRFTWPEGVATFRVGSVKKSAGFKEIPGEDGFARFEATDERTIIVTCLTKDASGTPAPEGTAGKLAGTFPSTAIADDFAEPFVKVSKEEFKDDKVIYTFVWHEKGEGNHEIHR